MGAAIEEKTQLRSDTSDEGDSEDIDEDDSDDIDPEHDHVYLGDGEWMLRSEYEEQNEEHYEGDSEEEEGDEGVGEDLGDIDCDRISKRR